MDHKITMMMWVLILLPILAVMGKSKMDQHELAISSISKRINQFSLEFENAIAENNDENENMISSPLSVWTLLSMINIGSGGYTKNELINALHLRSASYPGFNAEIQELYKHLNASSKTELTLANKIFVQKEIPIKPFFVEKLRFDHNTNYQNIDFSKNEIASYEINKWIEEKTNYRISDLTKPKDFDYLTKLVLVNTLYFKGDWQKKFNDYSLMTFTPQNGNVKPVDGIQRDDYFSYKDCQECSAEIIEIPYKTNNENLSISMLVVLPYENVKLDVVEKQLKKKGFSSFKPKEKIEINLTLPKFVIRSTINLESTLKKLNITQLFQRTANLSLMSDWSLKVNKMVQKVIIEVTKDGTEAAAASVAIPQLTSARYSKIVTVDRPFLVFICTQEVILFAGRVVDLIEKKIEIPEIFETSVDQELPSKDKNIVFKPFNETSIEKPIKQELPSKNKNVVFKPFNETSIEKPIKQEKNDISYISRGINDFSLQFHNALVKNDDDKENFISSPLSVWTLLAMITAGAGEQTYDELTSALHLRCMEPSRYFNGTQNLIKYFNMVGKAQFNLANAIFIQNTANIKKKFEHRLITTFNNSPQFINFSNPENATFEINEWIKQKTNSKIQNIIQKDDLNEQTNLVLVNTLHFKGSWKKKFTSTKISFTNEFGSVLKNVPAFTHTGYYKMIDLPFHGAVGVEIPYQTEEGSDDVNMVIIVPVDGISSLRAIEKELEHGKFPNFEPTDELYVRLAIPKFVLESTIDLSLPLQKLNITKLFTDTVDLSYMSDVPLKVKNMVQKVYIEVDENGTEGAAATVVELQMKMFIQSATLTIDRPFLVFIRSQNVTLFSGRVNNLTKLQNKFIDADKQESEDERYKFH